MSSQPSRSKLAQVARLGQEARVAEAAGRLEEAASRLEELIRLDPGDRRALHRLGDLYGIRLKRPLDAARCYGAEARAEERDDFQARALALWRLVVRYEPARLEAHERIGWLCVALGRLADARAHYAATAREMERNGRASDAAILLAHLAALADFGPLRPETAAPPRAEPAAAPDDNAADLAADRLQNGRLFHHYGLMPQSRQQLEELLVSFPEHVDGRRLLVEVCRALDDQEAAAEHMRVLTRQMREQGVAPQEPPAAKHEGEELPVEEWVGMVEEPPPADPMAELLEAIKGDVERVVEGLDRKARTT